MLPRPRRPRRGAPRAAVAGPGRRRRRAAGRPAGAPAPQGAPRSRTPSLVRRPRPSRQGFQRRGLHTAPPAAPEEDEDVEKVKCKTGRCGLRAPTMEGAAEAAPAPGCSYPSGLFSASASTQWPRRRSGYLRASRTQDGRPSASSAAPGCRK